MKTIIVDDITKNNIIKSITKIFIICIDTILYDSKLIIELLKIYHKEINTDINGKLFLKIEDKILFVFNLKEETIEVFINRISYTKRLMSLSLLRYSSYLWLKKEIQETYINKSYNNISKIYDTKEYICTNTPLKYLRELRNMKINTKEIFT